MVLVSLDDAVEDVQRLARKMGERVTPVLQAVTAKFEGTMQGLEFMIKGKASMSRKLISKIVGLYKTHQDESSYSPNLEECIQGE